MALRDPGMLEFSRLVDTEELIATAFARENGLLLSDQQICMYVFFVHPLLLIYLKF